MHLKLPFRTLKILTFNLYETSKIIIIIIIVLKNQNFEEENILNATFSSVDGWVEGAKIK